MPNTPRTAKQWVEFLSSRPEVPWGSRLMEAFNAGQITRLCDCGCNSFDFTVPDGVSVKPLARSGGIGSVFEISFEAVGEGPPGNHGTLEFIVFADERGQLAGVEVDFCGNSYPVPEAITLEAEPFHVTRSGTIDA